MQHGLTADQDDQELGKKWRQVELAKWVTKTQAHAAVDSEILNGEMFNLR
jgi:hypothetical protein